MKNKIILIQNRWSSLDATSINAFLKDNPNWEVVSITPIVQGGSERGYYGFAVLLKNNENI